MQVLPLDIDFEAELAAFQRRRSEGRTKGRHLSEIIHRIIAKLDPARFGGGEMDPALLQTGFLWEDVLSSVLAKQLGWKQLEIESDGVLMTLDGFNTRQWRVKEVKATKMSARNRVDSAKFWHWKIQICSYCRGMDTLEAELYPLFINGAYELGGGRFGKTIAKPRLLVFTKMEQRETWSMVLKERDRMDKEEAA